MDVNQNNSINSFKNHSRDTFFKKLFRKILLRFILQKFFQAFFKKFLMGFLYIFPHEFLQEFLPRVLLVRFIWIPSETPPGNSLKILSGIKKNRMFLHRFLQSSQQGFLWNLFQRFLRKFFQLFLHKIYHTFLQKFVPVFLQVIHQFSNCTRDFIENTHMNVSKNCFKVSSKKKSYRNFYRDY